MELREYWRIWIARAWIPIGLALIVAALTLLTGSPTATPLYTASFQVAAGITPRPADSSYYTYDGYYSWIASEYLTDDLADILRGPIFRDDVREALDSPSLADGASWQAERPENSHRLINVSIVAPDQRAAEMLAATAVQVVNEKGTTYLAAIGIPEAVVGVVDTPRVSAQAPTSRRTLEVGLRTVLGFVVGSALVFFLAYLDTTIRTPEDVQRTLGVPVLGEIPAQRRW